MQPGLKREAGASPARSRHCNWRELLQSTQRGVTGLLSGLGRPGKIANSQKPGDLPQVLLNTFAERCTGAESPSLTKKVGLFCWPKFCVYHFRVQDQTN